MRIKSELLPAGLAPKATGLVIYSITEMLIWRFFSIFLAYCTGGVKRHVSLAITGFKVKILSFRRFTYHLIFSVLPIVFLFVFVCGSLCQGTLRIHFDGPPPQPPETQYNVSNYFESGFSITPLLPPGPGVGFLRNGGGFSQFPENGTPYVQVSVEGLAIEYESGGSFGLAAVQLAGYSDSLPDYSMRFIGYVQGGGTVTNTFSGSGINFTTHTFGPEFHNLFRVIIPDYGSIDNLDLYIPEPTTGLLLLTAAAVLMRRYKCKP